MNNAEHGYRSGKGIANKKKPAESNDRQALWQRSKLILQVIFAMLFLIAVAGWFVYRSMQTPPEFYRTVITSPPDELENAGEEFESSVFELQNASRETGQWQATFTEKQVNGWLHSDLPEKFPDAIPPQIENPRIEIRQDQLHLVFRFSAGGITGYVVASGDAFCTEERNQIAVRFKSSKTGVIPIPIGLWGDAIAEGMRTLGCVTAWTEMEGDPVALIRLPENLTDDEDQRVELESVQLLDGKMVLCGVTLNDHNR